jgi:uncharacterized protein (DUF1015 family)
VVWRADAAEADALTQAFAEVPVLYIADGHHRAASAARAREVVASDEAEGLLAVAFPSDQLRILPYNRVVRNLNGATPEIFMREIENRFPVRSGPSTPAAHGEVSIYLGGRWWTLQLGRAAEGADPTSSLDVSVLQERVLEPLLGIDDVRTDSRIDFVGGARGPEELERLVDSGRAQIAFSMYPVSVSDLMTVADAGMIMPPKSTWFEPKLLDGVLVHEI